MKKRANNIFLWAILFCFSIVGVFLIVRGKIQTTLFFHIIFVAISVYFTYSFLFQLTHSIYLCENGIEIYCYGTLRRRLLWNDVCQICVMKPLPISMKVSAPTSLLIVPNGCDKYKKDDGIGYVYLYRHRKQVYRIDDSHSNRQIINRFYGEIDVQI